METSINANVLQFTLHCSIDKREIRVLGSII